MESILIKSYFESVREATYMCRGALGFDCFTAEAEKRIEAFETLEELSKGIEKVEDLYQIILDESITDELILATYRGIEKAVKEWRATEPQI